MLPGVRGYTYADDLKQRFSTVQLLFITGYGDGAMIDEWRAAALSC
jgi:hypothetical protein